MAELFHVRIPFDYKEFKSYGNAKKHFAEYVDQLQIKAQWICAKKRERAFYHYW